MATLRSLIAVACLPMILDICLAYHSKNRMRRQLLDEICNRDFG